MLESESCVRALSRCRAVTWPTNTVFFASGQTWGGACAGLDPSENGFCRTLDWGYTSPGGYNQYSLAHVALNHPPPLTINMFAGSMLTGGSPWPTDDADYTVVDGNGRPGCTNFECSPFHASTLSYEYRRVDGRILKFAV